MNIEEFYNEYVNGKTEEILKMREKEIKSKRKVLFMMIGLFIAILIGRIVDDMLRIEIISSVSGFLFLFGFPCILIIQFSKTTNSREVFKKKILTPFFNKCFENINYQYDAQFSKRELKSMLGIIPPNTKIYSNDIIYLKMKNREIKIGDIVYDEEERYGLFYTKTRVRGRCGILVEIPINNNNNAHFMIKSKRNLFEQVLGHKYCGEEKNNTYINQELNNIKKNQRIEELLDDKENREQSEYNQEFNEKFKLYNYKKENLKDKEAILEKILNIETQFNIIFEILVKNKNMYILIKNMQIFSDTSFELSKNPVEEIKQKDFWYIEQIMNKIQEIIVSVIDVEEYL